jgi:SpoVK/Ycf46/Vps4 family AAA+-type ATPase
MYTLTILNNYEDAYKYDLICWYLLKFHDNKKCNIVTNDRCDIPKNKFKIDCCKIKFLYKKKEIKIEVINTNIKYECDFGYAFIKKIIIKCISKDLLEDFLQYIKDLQYNICFKNNTETSVYTPVLSGDPRFELYKKFPKRNLDSVIIDKDIKKNIINNIETFYKDKNDYINYGIPYKNVILLHGPPGTGKSSILFSIASYFNKDVYILNFGSNINDEIFIHLLSHIHADSFLFLEDIDALFKNRDAVRKGNNGFLSFSTLLNFLDGVLRVDGLITFMTTNHIENLDPALLRSGRVNLTEKIDYPNKELIQEFYKLYFPNANKTDSDKFVKIVSQIKNIQSSTINSFLFNHRKCNNIFDFIHELKK